MKDKRWWRKFRITEPVHVRRVSCDSSVTTRTDERADVRGIARMSITVVTSRIVTQPLVLYLHLQPPRHERTQIRRSSTANCDICHEIWVHFYGDFFIILINSPLCFWSWSWSWSSNLCGCFYCLMMKNMTYYVIWFLVNIFLPEGSPTCI